MAVSYVCASKIYVIAPPHCLRCPKSPLRYLCIKSLLWTRKITLSRFRTVRKQSFFMDSKNYPLRCPKIAPVLLKQSEKLPLYGLRKLLFYIAQKPLSLVLASRARAILVHKLAKPLCCIALWYWQWWGNALQNVSISGVWFGFECKVLSGRRRC